MSDIHSCSYFCTRPACVLAQRDEMRDKLMKQGEAVVLTDEAIEAALTEWFGGGRSDGSGFEGRMRAAIKAACDFKEAK